MRIELSPLPALSLLPNGPDVMFESGMHEPPLVDENPYPVFS